MFLSLWFINTLVFRFRVYWFVSVYVLSCNHNPCSCNKNHQRHPMKLSAYKFASPPHSFSPLFWVVLVMSNEDQVRKPLMLLQQTPEPGNCCTGPSLLLDSCTHISSYLHKFFCNPLLYASYLVFGKSFFFIILTQSFCLITFYAFY